MSLWIQHGYGKGTKIWDLDDDGLVDGVVLSPADEDPSALLATAEELRRRNVQTVLDPQMYVWSMSGATARCHSDHGLEVNGLHWSMAPADVEAYVGQVLTVNERLGLDTVIAPTAFQRQLADNWAPLSIQLARSTLARIDSGAVYLSLVVDEGAFANWDDVEEWLDLVTQFEALGFYLVVARPRAYPQTWDLSSLTNILRLIYRLAAINEFEVLWGYSDLDGLAGLAAGATGIASGWYYTLRSFSVSKWLPTVAGGPARPRVTSARLLTPVAAEAEASRIVRASPVADQVFASARTRRRMEDPSSWSQADAWVQHLRVLSQLATRVAQREDVDDRVARFVSRVQRAARLLDQLTQEGVVLPPMYQSRLRVLERAVQDFAESEGV